MIYIYNKLVDAKLVSAISVLEEKNTNNGDVMLLFQHLY